MGYWEVCLAHGLSIEKVSWHGHSTPSASCRGTWGLRGGAGPHLQHGHLPPAAEQGHSHTQLVGTEAITLAGRREVEPLEVGDVVVSVQDGALSMPELGTGAWVQGAAGTRSHVR